MARKKTHGKTAGGKPITDKMVERLAKNAEAGYDVEETLRRRPGRPAIGSAPAAVESVRLEPELQDALAERAERDDETTSSVIRKALRQYLKVG
jgi:Ribbon-helix-helix protein, copG family